MNIPRIEYNLPAADYRKSEGVSKSSLDTFADCPAKFKAEQDGIIKRESSPAMTFGTLLHSLVLDGRADFHVKPDGMTFASKDGKQWKLDHADKPIIGQDEADELIRTSSAILKHRHAAPLFGQGASEVSLYGVDKESGLKIKGLADWLAKTHIVDIKTTRAADNRSISRAIADYAYHRQAALYLDLANQNGLDLGAFYFVFIERGDLPLINVRKIATEAIEQGRIEYQKLLRDLAECQRTGIWLDYSGDGEQPGEVDLPAWCYADMTGAETFKPPTEEMDASQLDTIP